MDDTIRQEEKDICERWAVDYGLELKYYSLEKGLGRLTRGGVQAGYTDLIRPREVADIFGDEEHLMRSLGLHLSPQDEESNN